VKKTLTAKERPGLWYDGGARRYGGTTFTEGEGELPMIENQHQPYDRSSKWLIQHHGDSILWLASVKNIRAWRPAQAELVQPRRLPDGLLEVRLEEETEDDLFLLEVATYPERRVGRQMTDDLLLVYLDRGQLPEAVTLVLRPKGKYRVPRNRNLRSRRGLSSCRLKWHVVELWKIPASPKCFPFCDIMT
jgi:hypothetical protein